MAKSKIKGNGLDVETRIAKKLDKLNRNNLRNRSEELLNKDLKPIVINKRLAAKPYIGSDEYDIPTRDSIDYYNSHDF